MAGREDPRLRGIAQEALKIGDTASAVIFVAATGSSDLELAAAAGVGGPPLDGLVAAVRNPAHPVTRALSDAEPSFDVRPTAPGGPALRSHIPLRRSADVATAAIGVLALAHESPMSGGSRRLLVALADRAAAAIVDLSQLPAQAID
jgi:hypothetical protein